MRKLEASFVSGRAGRHHPASAASSSGETDPLGAMLPGNKCGACLKPKTTRTPGDLILRLFSGF